MGRGVLRKSVQMKYAFIRDNQNLWSIDRLCSTLDVHHSGYYAWLKKPISKTARENQKLSGLIKQFWLESGGVYGYRKPRSYAGTPSVVAANILARQFNPNQPNQSWVTDISVPQQAA